MRITLGILCLGLFAIFGATGVVAAEVVDLGEEGHALEEGATTTSQVSNVSSAIDRSASSETSRTIERTQTLHLTPTVPGEIDVRVTYSIPEGVSQLRSTVPSRGTVTATEGFVHGDGNEYSWDRQTSTPTLTYRLPVNATRNAEGPIAGEGAYTFVDVGDWAIVRIPQMSTSWSWSGGTVGLSRSTTTAGPGEASEAIAFLGENRVVTHSAHGQTFRLVVPDRATLADSPTRILDSMAAASGALQVGDRDEAVFAVAAPTASVEWGVRGLQTGDADLWVRDVDRVDSADNVWLHEYVHTRQDYVADEETRWFTEASATYYAALLTLEQDRTSFQAFGDRLRLGTRSPDRDAILVDPSTWDSIAPYTKGALVAGDLDRRIRDATSRQRSLQDILGRMNSHDGSVTRAAFEDIVREASNGSVVDRADRYTTTREVPEVWDLDTHTRSFSTLPARIGYRIADTNGTGYAVRGPYRNGTTGPGEPIRLATGETLTVDVVTENGGGTTGEYNLRMLVDGEVTSRATGTVSPGESRTLSFSHRFAAAGEYDLSVGGHTLPVSVRRPATATINDVDVEERGATEGTNGSARLTARLANDGPYPAAANLTLRRGEAVLDSRRVGVGPNEERTITHEKSDLGAGEYVYQLGDRTVEFTIQTAGQPSTDEPGMGPILVAMVVAVALTVIVATLATIRKRR